MRWRGTLLELVRHSQELVENLVRGDIEKPGSGPDVLQAGPPGAW
jgi:crotonobetainyl-CoA:carnitine CoA-transferase CaiB-like acyl-CoA transferase